MLTEPEKRKCRSEIYEAISDALDPLVLPASFERKIYSAVSALEEKYGRLMLALNCECYRTLSEAELDELCGWWEENLSENNDEMSRKQIKTGKLGRIIIHTWFLNNWAVEPVFPGEQ